MSDSRTMALVVLAGAAIGCGGGVAGPSGSTSTSIAGTYTLTFSVSPVCSVAATGRQRSYLATVTQAGPDVAVDIKRLDTGQGALANASTGTVVGSRVRFMFALEDSLLDPDAFDYFAVEASGETAAGATMAGTMNGRVATIDTNLEATSCNATDHRFVLMRR